jgi:hypothetical protein
MIDILSFISDPKLLGPYFAGPSWDRWRAVLRAAYALPMSDRDIELFREVAERDPPRRPVRELIAIVGRGGGKDAIASAIQTFVAAVGDYSALRPGEWGTAMCLANDREQAGIAFGYVSGYFAEVPMLADMVKQTKSGRIDLNNGARVAVITANLRAPRGRRIPVAIYDEIGTWRSEDSASPDYDVDAAIAAGLMRHPGSMKILISTPYRRGGMLYDRWKRFFGKDDPDILVVLGTSRQFNPLLDQSIIDRELELDYDRAAAEYLCKWRDDISAFIDRAAIEAVVAADCRERGPLPGKTYVAFTDPSGGRADAMTLAIGHTERPERTDDKSISILDCLREARPPFAPDSVVAEFAQIMKAYRIRTVTGDNYAAEWPAERFRAHGITYKVSEKPRSDLYKELLPMINGGRVSLLNNERMINQMCSLERRVQRSGKDSVNHPDHGHDDLANAAAGVLTLAYARPGPMRITPEVLWRARQPDPRLRL